MTFGQPHFISYATTTEQVQWRRVLRQYQGFQQRS